jgi:hypothetical protein
MQVTYELADANEGNGGTGGTTVAIRAAGNPGRYFGAGATRGSWRAGPGCRARSRSTHAT